MKITKHEVERKFAPITLTITIESEDEVSALITLFSCSGLNAAYVANYEAKRLILENLFLGLGEAVLHE